MESDWDPLLQGHAPLGKMGLCSLSRVLRYKQMSSTKIGRAPNSPTREFIFSQISVVAGCWVWQGHRSSKGYGLTKIHYKKWKVHRLSYTIFKGPIPEGLQVRHMCHNPACVNPEHLEVGTHRQNAEDRYGAPKGVTSWTGMASALLGEIG